MAKFSCQLYSRARLDRLIGRKYQDEADNLVDRLADSLDEQVAMSGGSTHSFYDDGIMVCGDVSSRRIARQEIKDYLKAEKHNLTEIRRAMRGL